MDILAALSALCGWVYTLSWSLSFYPQPILNFRRRSTAGTTADFPFLNTLGFFSYLISNLALCYSVTVRHTYEARHGGHAPAAAPNDVVFAAHALALSFVTVSQYLLPGLWWERWWRKGQQDPVWRFTRRDTVDIGDERAGHAYAVNGRRRPSSFALAIFTGSIVVVFVSILLVGGRDDGSPVSAPAWTWLDVVYTLGYVKLFVTLIKYSPQVLANWRNRSTHGWSMAQILLDFAGGVLSIAQLLLDCYREGDWSGLTGNPIKLALGNVSMAYDLVFFTQHFILYPENVGDEVEEQHREEGYGGYGEEIRRERSPPDLEREALLQTPSVIQ